MEGLKEESHPFLDDSGREVRPSRDLKWLNPARFLSARSPAWTRSTLITTHLAVFITTSLVWGSIIYSTIHDSSQALGSPVQTTVPQHGANNLSFLSSEINFISCSDSVKEAKSKGCQYDILTNSWQPNQCIDELSIDDYKKDGSWLPYRDVKRTELLEIEGLGDRAVYSTSMRDHIVHCAIMWRRQFHALSEGRRCIDSITANAKHTMHCPEFLIKWTEKPGYRDTPIEVIPGTAGCHVRDV